MTGLNRTDLPTSQKIDLAASAAAAQGSYGEMSSVAQNFEVSRPTAYAAGATAIHVLAKHFEAAESGLEPVMVHVDQAQLERAVVALRVIAPNSIRAIESLLPILYSGVSVSYGTIQAIAAEASKRAEDFNAEADMSAIQAGAVDEMFSQGDPVLAGIDLDTSYLFALNLRESRSGKDWAEVLEAAKQQGLNLKVVVKDAAPGIAAGVREVFPTAEQRDDCFHAQYIMNKEQQRLERRAYGSITKVDEVISALARCRLSDSEKRSTLTARLVQAQSRCDESIDLHDRFEQAARQVQEALWFIDIEQARLRSAAEMRSAIESAAEKMLELSERRSQKVGRYLKNRAPGLANHLEDLHSNLDAIANIHGNAAVRLASVIHRFEAELGSQQYFWRRYENQKMLLAARFLLQQHAGDDAQTVREKVETALQNRHRASSAIEGFNAALRPFLYVHKGVNQEFLELFRAYYNLRTRRWGRHKGTSPHQCMTGRHNSDWLTMLGYPVSSTLH